MQSPRNQSSCAGLLLTAVFGFACGGSSNPDGAATDSAATDSATTDGVAADSSATDDAATDETSPSSSGDASSNAQSESVGSGPGSGTEGGECLLLGFAPEPSSWGLPAWPGPGPAFESFAGSGSCTGDTDTPTYATTDLDADGLPDLVVTSACDDGGVGGEHWIVFGNEGNGFGEATQWSLPDWPGAGLPFPALSNGGCAEGDGPDYAVIDLDGDAAPELVVTDACSPGDIGTTRWLVFPNTGQGFGEAKAWDLPDWPSGETPFGGLGGQESCSPATRPTYALVDLTTDGRPDLVVTSACGDGQIGDAQWLVFPNQGDGFGDATPWSLPDWPNAEFAFPAVSASRECATQTSPSYGLADLDGDEAVDLVVTQTCGQDPTGREQWLVFPNRGDGFGEATSWSLPDWPATTAPFPSLSAAGDCESDSAPTYALADLDLDRRPELVVTFACGEGHVGADRWLVFPNDGDGFADAEAFALPEWPGANGFAFDGLGGPGSCEGSNRPGFGLIDLAGEGWGALTVTSACGDGGLGRERWLSYARACG